MDNIQFLMIETGTDVCSVALSRGDQIIDQIIIREPRAHARVIGPLVNDILRNNNTSVNNCSAIVVSEGPGSYTGLRVGVSIAKGLCYGSGKPLIAVNSLLIIARQVIENNLNHDKEALIYSVLDARRNEVYLRKFGPDGTPFSDTEAIVLTPESFREELNKSVIVFAGNGAEKLSEIIIHKNARYIHTDTVASGMLVPALSAYGSGIFADVAYFEPFYLKDFKTGTSKKRLF
jgi:tRNA threonylcarbamoyladenosine biosynthesis protein TsaB